MSDDDVQRLQALGDDVQPPQASDRHTQVFIIRIWIEAREIAGAVVVWRGMIEHIPTQERRYLNDLAAIAHFITPYLQSMGANEGRSKRLQRWFDQWR